MRTLTEALLLCDLKTDDAHKNFGHKNYPITSIPFDHCIIDLLHALLRISDTLFDQIIDRILVLDANIEYKKSNLWRFFHYLEFVININNPSYLTKAGKFELRKNLNGNERLKILSRINLVEIVPDLPNVEGYQRLWRDFFNIYISLRNPYSYDKDEMARMVEESTLSWGKLYLDLNSRDSITPYIHAFVDHLHQMIKQHGDVCLWTMQGLEKLNDILSKEFYMCTNKHDDYLIQLIKRRNRSELMRLFADDPEGLFDLIHSVVPESTWSSL
jgi:hypothetical protein